MNSEGFIRRNAAEYTDYGLPVFLALRRTAGITMAEE